MKTSLAWTERRLQHQCPALVVQGHAASVQDGCNHCDVCVCLPICPLSGWNCSTHILPSGLWADSISSSLAYASVPRTVHAFMVEAWVTAAAG